MINFGDWVGATRLAECLETANLKEYTKVEKSILCSFSRKLKKKKAKKQKH
jgi:hypothetical protein